jgi:hypothetical protein
MVALLHIAAIHMLLTSLTTKIAPAVEETETTISLLPLPSHELAPKKRDRRPAGGTNAITLPLFNPDDFRPSMLQPPGSQGLSLALAACAPENYDMASNEVRLACNRIGMIVAYDPGHFGVKPDIAHAGRWQAEMLQRNRPLLAPCMSPSGPNILYTLYCICDQLWNGIDSEKMVHY